MKRFTRFLTMALLGSMFAGCGGGLEEGMPAEIPKESMSAPHLQFMKENAGKMIIGKGKPKGVKAPPKEATPADAPK